MLQHLSGGAWGLVVRRVFEAAARTLPLLALLFIPILLRDADAVPVGAARTSSRTTDILQHKAPYLNVPFFIGARGRLLRVLDRAVAWLLNKWSAAQDRGEQRPIRPTRCASELERAGLVVLRR